MLNPEGSATQGTAENERQAPVHSHINSCISPRVPWLFSPSGDKLWTENTMMEINLADFPRNSLLNTWQHIYHSCCADADLRCFVLLHYELGKPKVLKNTRQTPS